MLPSLKPDAIAVSGDLTQRCTNREFADARKYLDKISSFAPYIVVPGNHDIRWLGAVARNLGFAGMFREKAHQFKYSRYKKHISQDLDQSLEVPGAVIVGLNTAHGISRGSITTRFRDLGVIGHIKHRDIEYARKVFDGAAPDAARIVMIHHNPFKGSVSGRHGLANTGQALTAFASLGAELVLCGHDHLEAIHTAEEFAPGLVISTAGTISNRIRPGHSSTFNMVTAEDRSIRITTYTWLESGKYEPSREASFSSRRGSHSA